MKCQILLSGKNKKNISKCRLLKILPRVLSVNEIRRTFQNLTFKAHITTAADDILRFFFFFFFFLYFNFRENKTWNTIRMKCQVLFSLKVIKRIGMSSAAILLNALNDNNERRFIYLFIYLYWPHCIIIHRIHLQCNNPTVFTRNIHTEMSEQTIHLKVNSDQQYSS